MTPYFSAKAPTSTRVATIDATPNLLNGESLTSIISQTVTVIKGADPNPSVIIGTNPPPSINSTVVTVPTPNGLVSIAANSCVQFVITGGLDGTNYLIEYVCATSNPNKVLTLYAALPVAAPK